MTSVACLSLRSSAAMMAGSVVVASGTGVERPEAAAGPPGRIEAAEAEAIFGESKREETVSESDVKGTINWTHSFSHRSRSFWNGKDALEPGSVSTQDLMRREEKREKTKRAQLGYRIIAKRYGAHLKVQPPESMSQLGDERPRSPAVLDGGKHSGRLEQVEPVFPCESNRRKKT